jgi:hypothetical protein
MRLSGKFEVEIDVGKYENCALRCNYLKEVLEKSLWSCILFNQKLIIRNYYILRCSECIKTFGVGK